MKKREIMSKQFNPAALTLLYSQINLYIYFQTPLLSRVGKI